MSASMTGWSSFRVLLQRPRGPWRFKSTPPPCGERHRTPLPCFSISRISASTNPVLSLCQKDWWKTMPTYRSGAQLPPDIRPATGDVPSRGGRGYPRQEARFWPEVASAQPVTRTAVGLQIVAASIVDAVRICLYRKSLTVDAFTKSISNLWRSVAHARRRGVYQPLKRLHLGKAVLSAHQTSTTRSHWTAIAEVFELLPIIRSWWSGDGFRTNRHAAPGSLAAFTRGSRSPVRWSRAMRRLMPASPPAWYVPFAR